MAPTELLAEQHARSIGGLLQPFGLRVELLTGSVKGRARRAIYEGAADGTIDVLVGTHALIQEGVALDRLGLAVVDEQHRFGVEQRAALRQKGFQPHVLAMTATPIPRTLALTVYGDLDVVTIDERPPGRQPVETSWEASEKAAFDLVRAQVAAGRQAYVICPLVEETEKSEARAAVAEHRRLQDEVFPGLRVGLLHGKMKPAEKEARLAAFRAGEIDVLVATSVVEVGIDVPNATVMVVEEANRFGLAQLHQFRGRVGRGAARSYCVLLAESASSVGQERLNAITGTDDGFKLAEIDLRLRGAGDVLGTRQSGLPELKVAGLGDVRTIEEARVAAERLVAADPDLARPEHALLARRVDQFWRRAADPS
jgi:ATP-dependent DNA helicase RecG